MGAPFETVERRMNETFERMERGSPERPEGVAIDRVPESIRRADERAYEPKMLSIGPYHWGRTESEAMEKQKWFNLIHISKPFGERKFSPFLQEIQILEDEIRHCYFQNVSEFIRREYILEMMVLDGCFIIAILLSMQDENAWDRSHPIYQPRWVQPTLFHDILLLENQVPFFVLERLFHLITESNSSITDSLLHLALKFFDVAFPRMKRTKKEKIPSPKSVDHLLHLFHWYHRFSHSNCDNNLPIDSEQKPLVLKMIPPAMELRRAGIKLRNGDGGMLEVKFRNKVLEIPTLHLNDQTISLLRNLIALEQCSFNYGTDFTSYGFFVDCLIDTTEDLALLKRQLIIEHEFSMNEDVARHINGLCSGISFDNIRESYLQTIFEDVLEAYTSELNSTFRGWFRRIYFMKQSDKLQLQVAILSIYLSVMQTVFTVLSFRRPS